MDYRNGKCSDCGAEYKIPTSFAHDVAKCKQCGGIVRIEPAPAGAKPSGPVPAKRVEKRPEAPAPASVESTSAEQKRKERGTLAKLRAQRAAAEAGAAQAPKPKPATSAPKPAAARSKPAAVKSIVTTKGGTLASRTRKSSGKRRGGDGDEGFSSRRGAKTRKSGIPLGAMIAGGGLIVLLVGAGLYFGGVIGGGEEVEANETAAAPVEDAAPVEAVETPEEAPEEAAPEEAPVEEAPKEKAPPNPDDVKLDEIEDFGPARGTTDEEWTELNELMATFMDLDAGAKGPRAGRKLEEYGRKAYPVIVNHMKTLDFADAADYRKGDMCQKTLEKILNGRNFGWKYDHEENYVYYDKKVVENYAKSWRQVVTDVNAWISMAKLEEKDPEEAARLRAEFGDGAGAASPDDALGDDDLDVD